MVGFSLSLTPLLYSSDISAQYTMAKCHACTCTLLDEALVSGVITTFSTPSHSHIDVDTLGVAITKTMPVVLSAESLKPSIMLEPEAAKPTTATDTTSDCGSDAEDERAKPSPEIRNAFPLVAHV